MIIDKFENLPIYFSCLPGHDKAAEFLVGENIAYGQSSPEAVMNAWMNSSGHRANILNADFDKIGVGVVRSGGRLYWVQLFAG